jgi:hypothetical protein
LVVGFFVVGPAGPPVYASPQDVFEASKKASAAGDLEKWCQCLTDESRDTIVAVEVIRILGVRMELAHELGDAAKAMFRPLDQAFDNHGLTPQFLARVAAESGVLQDPRAPPQEKTAFLQAIVSPARNPSRLLADVYKALAKIRNTQMPDIVEVWQDATISDLKVTGNSATATLSAGMGKTGPIHFRNQGEGWRIELKGDESRPRLPPGHPPMPR